MLLDKNILWNQSCLETYFYESISLEIFKYIYWVTIHGPK